jgi:DNA-binding XRE family transcriptional regulator
VTSAGLGQRSGMGVRISQARRECGLTQRDLASALGTSLVEVDRIESGYADPKNHLAAISAATGRAEEWFTTLEPSPAPIGEVAGSADVRAPASGPTLLVLGAVTVMVTVRFFSETLHVVPKAANFVDIPIFLALVTAALVSHEKPAPGRHLLRVGWLASCFLALAALSALMNTSRVEVAPVLVFVYGFLAPLGIYVAVYRLWTVGSAVLLSRLLVALGVVELLVVLLIDLPGFIDSRDPDEITGTFGTNAYQLVFFLVIFIVLLIGIATHEPKRVVAPFAPLLIIAAFAVILLAQYRSLLVAMMVGLAAVVVLLGRSPRGVLAAVVACVTFVGAFYYMATNVPALKLESAATSVVSTPGTYAGGRLDVARNVFRLYGDIPASIAFGTGPGTYSSRAWQTFANADSNSRSNVQGAYALKLVGGKPYSTDVSDKYVVPQLEQGAIVEGSHAVSTPYSSYASLLAEVGVLGMLLIAVVYAGGVLRSWGMARRALRSPQSGDPLPALALATFVAFLTLVQAALLENWFEVTRVTFIFWIMLAVVTRELEARPGE